MTDMNEKYTFEAEWYDKVASVLKKFYLYYYPFDNTVELFDLKTKKTFLKRSKCEGIQARDFYIGGIVTIFSRNIKITNYADCATQTKLQKKMQKTFAIVKPCVVDKLGEILKIIISSQLHIVNIKMIKLSYEQAMELYHDKKEETNIAYMVNYIASGPIVTLELIGDSAITRWQEVMGPEDSKEVIAKAPSSIRALYGKDDIHNAVHGSENEKAAEKELEYFFPSPKSGKKGPTNTATLENCICCIIKPHAIQAKLIGNIVDDIQKAGYTISAIQQFFVNPFDAEEFLEVYKGVLPDYAAMVEELQSGPCIVMEIKHKDEKFDVQAEFRKLCGPMDPDIARQVRPDTLRAKYGKTKVQNAVHCSDLPEDGILEVEYFFKILENS
ncbi:nucleoside diphosphate kinase 7 [Apis mellifera caucasica]|uniref:Nucleoside diphosphate kinase 7 n=1 Tax=Apis mellifera TaxID=7460 RepID=A0A7M7RA50_APIME|nr:nucleoside diphosphate kinase 7 [Apis mellifera]KAG6797823.1 nucleoside diphosphate kinase 7 [Apis mellifera caucasica]KAG9430766.1 nucleoside diphosphate kinase 7 [Apis mellifera carnica]|eukprot:XP_396235.5 nucleoside diphosphate kinase 7 [Apis mellifera]